MGPTHVKGWAGERYTAFVRKILSEEKFIGVSQKLGFIYKTSTVEIVAAKPLLKSIHTYYGGDDSVLVDYPGGDTSRFFASGRLPFMMTANVTIDGTTEQINVVDLHARANTGDNQLKYDMRKYDVFGLWLLSEKYTF